MKVVNRDKIVAKFGSFTSFAKKTPFTLHQLNAVMHNKHRKYFHGDESGVFQAYKWLDDNGYMMDKEDVTNGQ